MKKNPSPSWTGKSDLLSTREIEVSVIKKKCIGDGACVAFAPEVFLLDSEDKAVVHNQKGATNQEKLLAAQICPVKAIIAKDVTTGKQVWPLPSKKLAD